MLMYGKLRNWCIFMSIFMNIGPMLWNSTLSRNRLLPLKSKAVCLPLKAKVAHHPYFCIRLNLIFIGSMHAHPLIGPIVAQICAKMTDPFAVVRTPQYDRLKRVEHSCNCVHLPTPASTAGHFALAHPWVVNSAHTWSGYILWRLIEPL